MTWLLGAWTTQLQSDCAAGNLLTQHALLKSPLEQLVGAVVLPCIGCVRLMATSTTA
jgi:hypothetical protein